MSDDDESPNQRTPPADGDPPAGDVPASSAAASSSQASAQPTEPPPPEDEYFTGERGRRIPRAALVVLGIAVVVLLVLIFARPSWFTRDVGDQSLHVPAERHFQKSLAGSGRADGVWLTDTSPSASFLVTFPADSARANTRVHLRGTTTAAPDSIGFLTVRMDGQQVFVEQLPSGEHALDAYIDVPEQITADGQVRVQMRIDSDLSDHRCTDLTTVGTQVHLAPDSIVEAALAEPVHTVRDAVVSWDRQVTIVVADGADEWKTAAAQLGIALTQAGHEVAYTDQMPTTDRDDVLLVGPAQTLSGLGWNADAAPSDGLVVGTVDKIPVLGVVASDGATFSAFITQGAIATADSAGTDPQSVPTTTPSGDDVAVADLGADTSVVDVTNSQNWRMRYSLADLPGGRLPRTLRVAMQLPATPEDLAWVMSVRLNDQMLVSRRLTQADGDTVVPLPAAAQRLSNDLTISVVRDRDIGGCDVRITPYPMQLLSSSALQLGGDPGAGFTAVPRVLAPGFAVYLPEPRSGDVVAELGAIVPVLADFVAPWQNPEFRWGAEPVPGRPFIVIGDSAQVAATVRLADGRIEAGRGSSAMNISAFDNGLIVQTATVRGGGSGLSVSYAGDAASLALPDFGRESAEIITAQGSLVVNPDGTTVSGGQAGTGVPG
ncbi:MAG: hypothetical protein SW127_03975 [Actinomycetota bacterium]|nr:hypothetical protein [Actinomycetota bacterium]